MFYYPAVLRRHSGCFSTIWLVATKGIRVTRRDFLKVNVTKTCDDIMDYLLERVEPPRSDLPRPRFSLYLSSQLQYGVILVYHRQCAILLEETQYVVDWLLKQKTSQKNDLDDHSRPAQLLKDALSLMEQTEGAPDPLFGEMYMQDVLPSPSALLEGHIDEPSPQRSPQEPTQPSPPVDDAIDRSITASSDSITMREPPPISIPFAEFEGVELADHHPDTLDLLLAQTDHFSEGEALHRTEPATDMEREQERREADLTRDRTKEQSESTTELQPTHTLSSEDHVLLPQEEPDLPLGPVERPVGELTPVSAPAMPSPPSADRAERQRTETESESSPEETRRRRRRRRRQLIFIDEDTQLSQEEQQQQIRNPQIQTAPAAVLPAPAHIMPTATELLNNPCTSLLAEELQLLWRQAAVITPVSGSDLRVGERGPDSTDSENVEREMVEMPEMAEGAEHERREERSKEIPRDVAEAEQLDISALTALPLEASDQMERSREISPMFTPDKEGSVASRSVSVLQDIPEETADVLGEPEPRSPGLLPELVEHDEGPMHFHSLLPPGCSRRTVSHHFMKLLEDLSSRKLQAEQTEPFGDILLSVSSGSL